MRLAATPAARPGVIRTTVGSPILLRAGTTEFACLINVHYPANHELLPVWPSIHLVGTNITIVGTSQDICGYRNQPLKSLYQVCMTSDDICEFCNFRGTVVSKLTQCSNYRSINSLRTSMSHTLYYVYVAHSTWVIIMHCITWFEYFMQSTLISALLCD